VPLSADNLTPNAARRREASGGAAAAGGVGAGGGSSGGGGASGTPALRAPWDAAARAAAADSGGVVEVTGVLRTGEDPGVWAVGHYPERGEFSWLDLRALAAHAAGGRPGPAAGGRPAPAQPPAPGAASAQPPAPGAASAQPPAPPLPLFVEAISPHPPAGAQPQPLTRQAAHFADAHVTPLTHLVYAATWGSLSLAGALIMRARFGARAGGALAGAARRRSGGRTLASG